MSGEAIAEPSGVGSVEAVRDDAAADGEVEPGADACGASATAGDLASGERVGAAASDEEVGDAASLVSMAGDGPAAVAVALEVGIAVGCGDGSGADGCDATLGGVESVGAGAAALVLSGVGPTDGVDASRAVGGGAVGTAVAVSLVS